jgi:hypothetical protein
MNVRDEKEENRWPPMAYVLEGLNVVDDARVTLIEHDHTYTLTYFERRLEPYGVIRVVTTPKGLEIRAGGERVFHKELK